jgi:hypothetical protein
MTTETPTPEFLPGVPDPQAQVSLPGLLLMVVGGCYIASCFFWIFNVFFGFLSRSMGGAMLHGANDFILAVIALVLGAANILGGLKMRNLQNYNMAMIGAVAAVLPCGCCCFAGIPVGIWALMVLMKPEVKAAFR